jgi:hypothetical protein
VVILTAPDVLGHVLVLDVAPAGHPGRREVAQLHGHGPHARCGRDVFQCAVSRIIDHPLARLLLTYPNVEIPDVSSMSELEAEQVDLLEGSSVFWSCVRRPVPVAHMPSRGSTETCEGPEKATRGGEWESIKIPYRNSVYIPKLTRHPSLLTQSRPHSYSKAIDPRNRVRDHSGNTRQC